MGVVYRARDAQLKRDVALKVLPDHLADVPDRLTRFQREAQLLASLSHHNIAQIHGFERTGDSSCIVMELVEGETLAERLQRGPIPIDEAVPFANQIANALEAAHARGIVHRDLKPANIKITADGTIKVLDFGLAKAFEDDSSAAVLSNSPTKMSGSLPGVIMGTAAYMSPEQARGRNVDARTDLWALGCVLYEMLTARAVFKGETATDIIAKVIEGGPDWKLLPPETPASVRMLLEAALTKDPKQRLQHAGDARLFLNRAVPAGADKPAVPPREHRSWIPIAALSLALVAALVPATLYFLRTPENPRDIRFELPAPGIVPNTLRISPDGEKVAYIARVEGTSGVAIWLRPIGTIKTERLPGTENASGTPFWSADSRFIAFYADRKLKKISIEGGQPVEIGAPDFFTGGAWSSDGVLLYSRASGGRGSAVIVRASDSGGEATPITETDPSQAEVHILPQFLPDKRHFLFHRVVFSGAFRGGDARLYVGSLDSKASKAIASLEFNIFDSPAIYAPPGFLLFVRSGSLVAQKLDLDRLEVVGGVIPIAEQVSAFSVSENHRLLYLKAVPGSQRAVNQLTWFDRKGMRTGDIGAPSDYTSVALSPDDRHLAVDILERDNRDIWRIDLDRGTRDRLTADTAPDLTPIWEPSGGRVVFASQRGDNAIGNPKLFLRSSNSVGSDTMLFQGNLAEGSMPLDWSPDGKSIVFLLRDGAQARRWDLWIKTLAEEKPTAYLQSDFRKTHAQFSPDGRWVAYTTNESGTDQVVVQSFPDPAKGKWPVSPNGGVQPRWRKDGRELFYIAPDGKLMAVDVKDTGDFSVGAPRPLFAMPFLPFGTSGPPLSGFSYDVTSDGQRFVVIVPVSNSGGSSADADPATITTVLDWTVALRKPK